MRSTFYAWRRFAVRSSHRSRNLHSHRRTLPALQLFIQLGISVYAHRSLTRIHTSSFSLELESRVRVQLRGVPVGAGVLCRGTLSRSVSLRKTYAGLCLRALHARSNRLRFPPISYALPLNRRRKPQKVCIVSRRVKSCKNRGNPKVLTSRTEGALLPCGLFLVHYAWGAHARSTPNFVSFFALGREISFGLSFAMDV